MRCALTAVALTVLYILLTVADVTLPEGAGAFYLLAVLILVVAQRSGGRVRAG